MDGSQVFVGERGNDGEQALSLAGEGEDMQAGYACEIACYERLCDERDDLYGSDAGYGCEGEDEQA